MDEERNHGPIGRVADGPRRPVDCLVCGERISDRLAESGPPLKSHYAAAHPDLRSALHPDSAIRPDAPTLCLVCGLDFSEYPPDEWPWGPDGTMCSFEFCICCGVHWGYSDATLPAVRSFRAKWAAAGYPWDFGQPPADWSPPEQIKRVPVRAR